MLEAMSRKPVLAHRTPIANSKNANKGFRSPHAKQDAKVLQQIAEKRRARQLNSQSSPKEEPSLRLPGWALSEIQDAHTPRLNHRRIASNSTLSNRSAEHIVFTPPPN